MKVLIASANGYGNAGDDICAIVSENLVRAALPDAEVIVTAPPFDEQLAADTDVFVLGGGGIIYDANFDNMENYLAYVDYGIKYKKKTIGLGLGEQGIVTKPGEARYKKAFNKMDLLTLRSTLDAERLTKFGTKGHLATQDLAFSFDFSKYRTRAHFKRMLRSAIPWRRKLKLGVVLSNQEHLVNDLKLAFSKEEKVNALNFKKAFEKNISVISEVYDITIITQSRDDLEMAEVYKNEHGCKVFSYHTREDLDSLLKLYGEQDLILTQRFHGVVFSMMMDIPVIALGYHGQKQYKLLNDLGLQDKLIMYHQPEALDTMIADLGMNDKVKVDTYAIHLNKQTTTQIMSTVAMNQSMLRTALNKRRKQTSSKKSSSSKDRG